MTVVTLIALLLAVALLVMAAFGGTLGPVQPGWAGLAIVVAVLWLAPNLAAR